MLVKLGEWVYEFCAVSGRPRGPVGLEDTTAATDACKRAAGKGLKRTEL